MKRVLSVVLLSLVPLLAQAQIVTLGDDPANLRWATRSTRDYRIIYPQWADSLACSYAVQLQRWYGPVSQTAGFSPNQQYRQPIPVILHACTGEANGAVVWAPRRMELFTLPDAYGGLGPMPWEQALAIHETRHVAQHQFARDGWNKGLHILFGELPSYMIGGFYPNAAIMEGDAVVAETALTASGRGRTADFLSYIRMSFDRGDFRDWYRWRYGSAKYYTPDYYKIGYMTVAGMRYLYDYEDFTAEYLRRFRNPFRWDNLRGTVKRRSGESFDRTWRNIALVNRSIWQENDRQRGPLVDPQPVLPSPPRFASYRGTVPYKDGFLAVKGALDQSATLVFFDPYGERTLRPFASGTSKLAISGDRIYWSESVPSQRWSLAGTSRIRFLDPARPGKIHDLTTTSRYFNPAPSPDGKVLAAVQYPVYGGSSLVLLSAEDGTVLDQVDAPSGLQFTETAIAGETIYLTGISEEGTALYAFPFTEGRIAGPRAVCLPPQPVKIQHLRADGDGVLFVCDRTTVNEIYRYDGNGLVQLTATRYGVSSPVRTEDGLLVTALLEAGSLPALLEENQLRREAVSYEDRMAYPIADKLSAQEQARGGAQPEEAPEVTESKPYSKLGHLIHIHSWAPFWYNGGELASAQYQQSFGTALPGAMAAFQNHLGTASGTFGVSVGPDPLAGGWKPAAHVRFRYSGLLPVLEWGLDYGGRVAADYRLGMFTKEGADSTDFVRKPGDEPYFRTKVALSVPLDITSGGWERHFEPRLAFGLSNDVVQDSPFQYTYDAETGDYRDGGAITSPRVWERDSYFDISLRYSAALPTAVAHIFPRKGGGFLAGLLVPPGTAGSATVYARAHAYVPGFGRTSAFRLVASGYYRKSQFSFYQDLPIDTNPRGFVNSQLPFLCCLMAPHSVSVSLDYAQPLLFLDSSALCPYLYIRNFELIPFLDISWLGVPESLWRTVAGVPRTSRPEPVLLSAGADINVCLPKLLFVQNELSVGLRVAWNGGPGMAPLQKMLPDINPFYVGLNVRTDLEL